MVNLNGFDANEIEPSTEFTAIPEGKYLVIITDSEKKSTKNGTGSYVQFTFQILEGEYKNRLLWARLNLDNSNKMAVQIAQSELSAICRSVGVMAPTDTTELHNLPLVISVKCKKRVDNGEMTNEIRGYYKNETAPAPIPVSTTVPSDLPWKRP